MKALLLTLVLCSFSALAGVTVTGVNLTQNGSNGTFHIGFNGNSAMPDLTVRGNIIEVVIDRADNFKAIHKKVSNTDLSATLWNGKAVMKAVLPFGVKEDQVSLNATSNRILVSFPMPKVAAQPAAKAIAPAKSEVSKVTKSELNESYLNNLMNENRPAPSKDEVQLKQASVAKPETPEEKQLTRVPNENVNNFSFAGYALKFTVFLALVLGLFYGLVQLFKKGVFTRGKLGFLNNSQMIEVLSTTYVAPKRSLMIVRAHNQVFLVGNSESGITFLSEMKDTTGLLKESEKWVGGSNFDTNMTEAEADEMLSSLKLKEDITKSTPIPETKMEKLASAKNDVVRFSDELKKKAKKLRPIENRVN